MIMALLLWKKVSFLRCMLRYLGINWHNGKSLLWNGPLTHLPPKRWREDGWNKMWQTWWLSKLANGFMRVFYLRLEIFTVKVFGSAVRFLMSHVDTDGGAVQSRVQVERTRMICGDGAGHSLPSSFPPPLPSYEWASPSHQAEGSIKNSLAGGSSGCLLGSGESA